MGCAAVHTCSMSMIASAPSSPGWNASTMAKTLGLAWYDVRLGYGAIATEKARSHNMHAARARAKSNRNTHEQASSQTTCGCSIAIGSHTSTWPTVNSKHLSSLHGNGTSMNQHHNYFAAYYKPSIVVLLCGYFAIKVFCVC